MIRSRSERTTPRGSSWQNERSLHQPSRRDRRSNGDDALPLPVAEALADLAASSRQPTASSRTGVSRSDTRNRSASGHRPVGGSLAEAIAHRHEALHPGRSNGGDLPSSSADQDRRLPALGRILSTADDLDHVPG